ncbi:hypothetical protein HELRODRAFT_188504 [Helobdella robusta]|uniref:ubiquitinyl hydrolase 1 n=1 Tax=Helobdella robusta TaxID=6412 RepID=T1FQ23_HELRO|nr:hypothetical protein HELRODRAFT_188504 [Helobdella robusta]ESO01853.1 hypothetical protein HELRODRAFT_188504 [Helobdella robusta]
MTTPHFLNAGDSGKVKGEDEHDGDLASADLEAECLARQKKERKELQAEIQKLKHTATKGDKRKKRDVLAQIAILEKDLDEKQQEELIQIHNEMKALKLTEMSQNVDATIDGDFVENSVVDIVPRISKSQKRRVYCLYLTQTWNCLRSGSYCLAKKAQKECELNERIRLEENEPSNRKIEENHFKQILDDRNLQMYTVPSDGNCLYASMVHQLSQNNIQTDVGSLREQVSFYMRQNVHDFLPFFVHEHSGDLFTHDEFTDYCSRVEETCEWGGQAELKALSDIFSACIEVVQADVPSHFIGLQFKDKLSIIVTYHKHAYGLGEHYNSVCLKVDSVECETDRQKNL